MATEPHSGQPATGGGSALSPDDHPVRDAAARLTAELVQKPTWRGWIHAVAAPFAVIAGIVLVSIAPTALGKATCAIYAVTGILLFGVSALYHRGNWRPGVHGVLKRLDHTNIMLVIAGTYTPISALLLPPRTAALLLWIIWVGAILGVLFRVLWVGAPRWLYVPIYIALGLAAVFFLPDLLAASVPATLLIMAGGVFYIAGAIFYALKRPNPNAAHFGFHELFHAFTVVGFALHFSAIVIAVFH